ncbi:glycine-rich protein 2-like [Cryptomeria japonica]|uniref:glycine-rich protein 2-like n=1 Tax=Cryptomeria japonica TaxID=3369 RepID=UPI0027DA9149|nr:glycine-rich protein 2-like [Cryptomeria japonica]
MKLRVKLIRTYEVLKALKVVVRMEVGRELWDRFEEGRAVQFLASLEGDLDFENLDWAGAGGGGAGAARLAVGGVLAGRGRVGGGARAGWRRRAGCWRRRAGCGCCTGGAAEDTAGGGGGRAGGRLEAHRLGCAFLD